MTTVNIDLDILDYLLVEGESSLNKKILKERVKDKSEQNEKLIELWQDKLELFINFGDDIAKQVK